MAFQKVGSPQPIQVLEEVCSVCGKNKAQFNENGRMICSECRNISQKEEVNE